MQNAFALFLPQSYLKGFLWTFRKLVLVINMYATLLWLRYCSSSIRKISDDFVCQIRRIQPEWVPKRFLNKVGNFYESILSLNYNVISLQKLSQSAKLVLCEFLWIWSTEKRHIMQRWASFWPKIGAQPWIWRVLPCYILQHQSSLRFCYCWWAQLSRACHNVIDLLKMLSDSLMIDETL